MTAAVLLSRLEGVRQHGKGWRANCPNGHNKTKGSLSIACADDGRVLMHCFACHDVQGILSAVGLELSDLFPERIRDPSPEARQRAQQAFMASGWKAALGVLGREATIVEIAAHDLAEGHALAEADHDRLLTACERIHAAREVLT